MRRQRGTRKLFLHIGLAKTGTTYLQGLLADHRKELKKAGTLYPFIGKGGLFHAAVEILEAQERWGLEPAAIAGSWDRVVAKAQAHAGDTVFSHEILAGASTARARHALEPLAEHEVHLVITLRDLARQVPAFWQESVKNGSSDSFAAFAEDLSRGPDVAKAGFWNGQSLLHVMNRWKALVPPERVHIVVCPEPGAPPAELWRRFAEAIDVPADALDSARPPANESLGCTQIRLLRDVNAGLAGALPRPDYIRVVKRRFTAEVLAASTPARRPLAPESMRPFLDEVTGTWLDLIAGQGYQVHGELADLAPSRFAPADEHPDQVTDAELAALGPAVTATLLRDLAQQR